MTDSTILEKTFKKLLNLYPRHDLTDLIFYEKSHRERCQKRGCPCYTDRNLILSELRNRIDSHLDLFREYKPDNEQPPVSEFLAENPLMPLKPGRNYLSYVTIEDVYEFFMHLVTVFNENYHHQENILRHNIQHCDCVRWLYNSFEHVRQSAPRRILKGLDEHNTFCAAIWCFCIEAGIITRKELLEFKESVGNVSSWWWHHVFPLVGEGYVRNRRKRKPQYHDFEPHDCITAKQKWDRFYADLVERYPVFFTRINNQYVVNKTVFTLADPGPVFNCFICHKLFPLRYAVFCEPFDALFERGQQHHYCRVCIREQIRRGSEVPEGRMEGRSCKLYIKCYYDDCERVIWPKKVNFFLDQKLRIKLSRRMIKIMVAVRTHYDHLQDDVMADLMNEHSQETFENEHSDTEMTMEASHDGPFRVDAVKSISACSSNTQVSSDNTQVGTVHASLSTSTSSLSTQAGSDTTQGDNDQE